MANTITLNTAIVVNGSTVVSTSQTATDTGLLLVQEAIAGEATNVSVAATIDTSALKGLGISCDQEVTVKTNSSDTPDDTFTIKPGAPLTWTSDSATANPISEDVTGLFVTNAGAATANLVVAAVTDATPA